MSILLKHLTSFSVFLSLSLSLSHVLECPWCVWMSKKLPANKNEPPDRMCVILHASSRMRGDTWASTCPVVFSLAIPEDTSMSTFPSSCLVFMHRDTRASACRFACADRRYYITSCFCVSSCIELLHARLHLLLMLTLSRLNGWHHVLIPYIKLPQASRSIYAISALLVNFRPAINPKYFSDPVLMT